MSKTLRNTLFSLMGSAICAGFLSCGSATNNDQGTSFLAFGWYQVDNGGQTPISGLNLPIATDSGVVTDGTNVLDGLQATAAIALQNRLTSQFITLKRIDCSYNIDGTNLNVPNDSFNTSAVLAPAANPTGGEPTLPGAEIGAGSTNFANEQFITFTIVSTDIYSFLNVYRTSLPELPFRMTAVCHAVGTTQAGDTITTNDLSLPIYFFDTAECCTGNDNENPAGGNSGGFQGGAGTDGGVDFSDGTNSTNITTGTGNAETADAGV